MTRWKLLVLLAMTSIVLTGCQSVENGEGFFYNTFVKPMDFLLDFLGNTIFNGSYGLAIITITIMIRLLLMPFMLKNYRSQAVMRMKMDEMKPKMEEIQQKLKAVDSKEEQRELQQEMMQVYRNAGVNPINMGCLPMLIQLPIIMGLYFAILNSADVKSHEFLWFSLGSPDIVMTAVAGVIYFIQSKVSLATVPQAQQAQMKLMMYISPIMIVFISYSSMAALPLYWSVGGFILIVQTYIGKKYFSDLPEQSKTK